MTNKLKSVRKGSKTAASPQSKTAQRRAEVYPAPSQLPFIALFPEGDDSTSEEVIDLSKAEFAALKQAAAPSGYSILMFMANAALEKIGFPGAAGHRLTTPGLKELGVMMDGIVLKIADHHGKELGNLNVDDVEAGLLQKLSTTLGLSFRDLLSFIILRQLEAFFPSGAQWQYRVSVDAVAEITNNLSDAERDSDALCGVCRSLAKWVNEMERSPSTADHRSAVSKLKGLSLVVQDLSSSLRMNVSDANAHWSTAGRPALLEKPMIPAPIPLARGAAGRQAKIVADRTDSQRRAE